MSSVAEKARVRSRVSYGIAWPPRQAAFDYGAAALLLLVCVLLGLFARGRPPDFAVDFTRPNPTLSQIHLAGFYPLEQTPTAAYSWTSGSAFVQIPFAYHSAPRYRVAVRLRADNPQGAQPLTFRANERDLLTTPPDTRFRTYHLLLPPAPVGDTTLRFALSTPTFVPAVNPRALGVIVTHIALQAGPATNWVPPLLLGLGALAYWALLRRLGSRPRAALLAAALLAAALLALYARYRPAPLSYLTLAGMALAASGLACALARETASRLALALLATLVSFSGMLWPSWLSDDAFISFRYAQNLVAGNGLVYNVGERVEGYTNFLWTMLAALLLRLGGDLLFWAYASGVLLALALLLLTYALAQRLIGSVWALVAALIVATSQSVLIHTARGAGLETGLFALLALSGSALYIRWSDRDRERGIGHWGGGMGSWSVGLIFALATLTRPEGALLMALTTLHALLTTGDRGPRTEDQGAFIVHRPSSIVHRLSPVVARLLLPYLLIVVPFFFWRFSYYGDLLPNTFYAKTGGGVAQILRGLSYAGAFALTLGGPLLLLIGVPLLLRGRAALRGWRGYLLLLLAAYSAYIIAVGGDHFKGERFFVPLVPWFALLMADGLAHLWRWLTAERQPRTINRQSSIVNRQSSIGLLLAIGLIAFSGYALARTAPFDYEIGGLDESVWIWRELGWWMQDHAGPDESIAALGAGAVAYYGQHTTIDLLGLTDKHIARVEVADMGAGTAGHEKRDPAYVLDVRRPTYIPQIWDGYFGGAAALRGRYELITITTRTGRELAMWRLR